MIDRPGLDEIELCQYLGKIRGMWNDSWAAVSTCGGSLQGVVFDGTEMHFLEKVGDVHFLYRESDRLPNNYTCGYSSHRTKRDIVSKTSDTRKDENYVGAAAGKDIDKKNFIKGPWNANRGSRYVELVLVVDNKEFHEHGSDLDKIYRICKDIANVMNALYTPLNIYIALVGVVVWTEYDEIKLDTMGDKNAHKLSTLSQTTAGKRTSQ